jgi:hypothetical protein
MTHADSQKGEIISGFKCIGHTKDRQWAQFKIDNSQEWTEQQREEWQRRNDQRRTEQAKDSEQRRQRSLSPVERDQVIRKLHSYFGLSSRHREDLKKRGLTDSQIDRQLYFTITPNQKVPFGIPANLPGIRDGQIKAAGTGYACVAFDAQGKAIGWQIRLDSTTDNKYRWAKGEVSSHLANGELPISSVYPDEIQHSAIWSCEGISKPGIAANRLGIVTIGAASANFAASSQQVEEHLGVASERLQTKEIIFAPDAGAVKNSHVLKAYKRSWELFIKLGYQLKVAWWGQTTKDHPDVDELTDYSKIEFISPDEFCAIAKRCCDSEAVATQLAKDATNPPPVQHRPTQEKAKEAWHGAKRFTADIQKASQWCDWKLPQQNSIFFGRAGLGRGKTTRLRNWVRSWQEEGKGFICLGYRNTLLLQLCEKLGFYHLHENDAAVMRHNPSSGIALCVDSLWRFRPEEFDDKILILDEVMSVIRHLLHSPTVKGRDNILGLFEEALQRASQVICLDGCMADWAVKYLHELAPGKKIIRADNTFQGERPTVNFLLGTVDIEEKVRKNDRSPWLDYLLNHCAVPAICSDSQVFIESLDNLLTERGLKTLRVDSKTVPEEDVREFLKDCNAYIEKEQPDAILYTPSAESGVDISISGYFTAHVSFFFGVLGVDSILQMLGRIRDAKCTKFVWVREWVAQSEQTHSKSPFTKKVGQAIEKMLCQDITDTMSGIDRDQDIISKLWAIIQDSKNPHFEASNQIQAITNYEKSNLRECVLESLEASGYPIRSCTLNPSEEAKEKVKAATEETKRQNCHDIFTAEKIAPEFADDLSKKFDARWEDRVKVIQASYRSRLPGIDESSSWTEKFIYKIRYDNPDFISQQELFWLFSHPEEANRMNQERYHRIAQKERTFIGNIRSRMARIRALREIGFEQFLGPDKTCMEDSPELVEFVNRCKDEKIAVALGRHPGKQSNIRFLGSCLKMFGLKLKGQKVKSPDGDYRIYRVDRDILSDPDRINALQCLDRRWENYLTKQVEILNWDSVLDSQEATAIDNHFCQQEEGYSQEVKSTQTQMQQALEAVPRTPSEYIYNLGTSWNQIDQVESQGVGEALEGGSPVEELAEALEFCDAPDVFAAVIEGYEPSQIEDAIAVQDTQPRRQELRLWYEAGANDTASLLPFCEKPSIDVTEYTPPSSENIQLQIPLKVSEQAEIHQQQGIELSHLTSSSLTKTEGSCSAIEDAVKLLIDAISHGAETIQAVLCSWNSEERWSALLGLDEYSKELIDQLILVAPQIWKWAG